MSASFIPPIPIGQFKPSSEAIASWLYEVWKYLQENPIPTGDDVEQEATEYIAQNVPPLINSAIANIEYSDIVGASSALPVYRASNDEMGQDDLLEAWSEGCRFALVDDEDFFILYNDNGVIGLVQVLTESQASGVVSVNGKTGIVVLKTSDLQNDSGFITANGAPVQSVNGQTGAVLILSATQTSSGLMSATDKTKLDGLNTPTEIAITPSSYIASRAGTKAFRLGRVVFMALNFSVTSSLADATVLFSGLPEPIISASEQTLTPGWCGVCAQAETDGAMRIKVINGVLRTDGAAASGWYNGSLAYVTAE